MILGPGNLVAAAALLLWVPFSFLLFVFLRPPIACAATLLGGVALLPVGTEIEIPVGQPLDKYSLPALCAFTWCMLVCRGRLFRARPGRGADLFWVALVVGAVLTALANGDSMSFGPTFVPGLGLRDGASEALQYVLLSAMPFFLGRALVRSSRDLREVSMLVVGLALAYSLLVLVELRLSPQFHRWVYGYHQHMFAQVIRPDGSYRPMVFMYHGLHLSMFFLVATFLAAGLSRSRPRLFQVPSKAVAAYLGLITLAIRSLATAVYAVVFLPVAWLAPSRAVVRVAALVALVPIAYPLLRTADLVPTDRLLELARLAGPDRAHSLEYRFDNEDGMVARAKQRPLLGWGTYGRPKVWDERTGEMISVVDGYWILTFGRGGLLALVGAFGLRLFPVFYAASRLRRIRSVRDRQLLAALSLCLAVVSLDLIPNSAGSTTYILFLAGGLTGAVPGILAEQRLSARRHAREPREAANVWTGAAELPATRPSL